MPNYTISVTYMSGNTSTIDFFPDVLTHLIDDRLLTVQHTEDGMTAEDIYPMATVLRMQVRAKKGEEDA